MNKLIMTTAEIADPGSRSFSLQIGDELLQGFVVCRDGGYFAYKNRCPHTGAPLDWVEHQFLDLDQCFIQCAVHDARFSIETGECVSGPCPGEFLQALLIRVDNGEIHLLDESVKR